MPTDRSTDTASNRELSADLYRVLAVIVVVIGHWLVSAVTFHDGQFGNDYPLDAMPWTRWLTLVFQVVPVFFLSADMPARHRGRDGAKRAAAAGPNGSGIGWPRFWDRPRLT